MGHWHRGKQACLHELRLRDLAKRVFGGISESWFRVSNVKKDTWFRESLHLGSQLVTYRTEPPVSTAEAFFCWNWTIILSNWSLAFVMSLSMARQMLNKRRSWCRTVSTAEAERLSHFAETGRSSYPSEADRTLNPTERPTFPPDWDMTLVDPDSDCAWTAFYDETDPDPSRTESGRTDSTSTGSGRSGSVRSGSGHTALEGIAENEITCPREVQHYEDTWTTRLPTQPRGRKPIDYENQAHCVMRNGPKAGQTYENIAKDQKYVSSLTNKMMRGTCGISQQEARFVSWHNYTYGGYIAETINDEAVSRKSNVREESCERCYPLVILGDEYEYCQDCGWAKYKRTVDPIDTATCPHKSTEDRVRTFCHQCQSFVTMKRSQLSHIGQETAKHLSTLSYEKKLRVHQGLEAQREI